MFAEGGVGGGLEGALLAFVRLLLHVHRHHVLLHVRLLGESEDESNHIIPSYQILRAKTSLTLSDKYRTHKAFPCGELPERASEPFPWWRRCRRTRKTLK